MRVLTSLILTLGIFTLAWLSPQKAEAEAPANLRIESTTYPWPQEEPSALPEMVVIAPESAPEPILERGSLSHRRREAPL